MAACEEAHQRRALSPGADTLRVNVEAFPEYPAHYQRIPYQSSQHGFDFPLAAKRVPMVYACVDKIANDVAGIPLRFYQGTGKAKVEIERAPGNIVDIWAKANPGQSSFELEVERQSSMDLNGNGYLFLETFGSEKPTPDWEIWSMPSYLVRPVAGPHRTEVGYEWIGGDAPEVLDPRRIIHLRYWNPFFAPAGLSPLEAARLGYEARYFMSRWQREFYARGGLVANVYSSTDPDAPPLKPEVVKEIKKRLMALHGGLEHAYEPVILDKLKLERAGLTQEEMNYTESLDWTDADICRVFGIPPVVMGIKQGGGLSDAGATTDMILYHENCLRPRLRLRDAVLTERFCSRWGKDVSCESDVSGVMALQDAKVKQYDSLAKATGRPFMKVNEARVASGLPALEDPAADELYLPPAPTAPGATGGPVPPSRALAPLERHDGPVGIAIVDQAKRIAHERAGKRRRNSALVALFERRFERRFLEIYDAQEAAVLELLRHQFYQQGLQAAADTPVVVNPDVLASAFDDEGHVNEERVRLIFYDLVMQRGEEMLAELGLALEVQLQRYAAQAFIENAARVVLARTSETTTKRLREIIGKAIADGEATTYTDFAKIVNDVFKGRRDNVATVARTETLGAFNFASLDAVLQTEVATDKTWFTAEDELVRDAHAEAEADGPIDVEKKFRLKSTNGDIVEMAYPGDPAGTADLVINCRCVLQFTVDEKKVRALRARVAAQGRRHVARPDLEVPAALVTWWSSGQ